MPVPAYDAMMLPLLKQLGDGQEHENSEVRDKVAEESSLSEAERAERSADGRQLILGNRFSWATTYLRNAGLITSPRRTRSW